MVKKENDTRGLADVEAYFNQIRTLLKQYRCVAEAERGGPPAARAPPSLSHTHDCARAPARRLQAPR